MLTISEVAEKTGMSRKTIARKIRRQELRGFRTNWADRAQWMKDNPRPGAPPKIAVREGDLELFLRTAN